MKKTAWRDLFTKDMLLLLAMGISSGLPLALTGGTLSAWLKSENVDLGTIGLFALVGLPYSLKFLWSPLMDRFVPLRLGRRRSWMLITQILLIAAVVALGMMEPQLNLWMVGFLALLVSFFSASQDIVLDAWRRERLSDENLGFGTSVFVSSYLFSFRIISGSLALILADHISWQSVYFVMACFLGIGVLATLKCQEPVQTHSSPKTIREAVIEPFKDFFSKPGAWLILVFILIYKIGDNMALTMSLPFYLDTGFTKTEIGTLNKLIGWVALVVGQLIGGITLKKLGINRCLLWFGILQGLAVYSFSLITIFGKNLIVLGGVISFENIAIGMGTIAFVTFMASITNRRFTATQYALLSSLMGVPRNIMSAPTGYIAKFLGWPGFFLFCALMSIPGILLVRPLNKLQH